jgi:hypothetical protein
MPILTYFAVVGTALMALLFYASASMEPRGPLAVTSNFEGLPPPWHGPAVVQNLVAQAAPEPDMNSDAVKSAAPAAAKTAAATTTGQGAQAVAKAEIAPKKKKHVARRPAPQEQGDTRRYAWQNGSPSPFGLFGRF